MIQKFKGRTSCGLFLILLLEYVTWLLLSFPMMQWTKRQKVLLIIGELVLIFFWSKILLSYWQVKDDGTFVDVRTVGQFCYEDDELVFQHGLNGQRRIHAYRDQTVNSLKHRLLVHLYRKAVYSGGVRTSLSNMSRVLL